MNFMRCFRSIQVLVLASPVGWCQAATPLGALDELTKAENLADIVKHYPAAVEEVVNGLPENEKAEALKRLSIALRIREAGYELHRTDDLRFWQFADRSGSVHVTLTLVNYFISGVDSVVLFNLESPPDKKELKFASLRYESGEWRIRNFGDWRSDVDLESEGLVSEFTSSGRNEKAAALTLMKLAFVVGTYERADSVPRTLDVLSQPVTHYESTREEDAEKPSPEESDREEGSAPLKEPAPTHVYLPGMVFSENRAVKDGYEFRYTFIAPAASDDDDGGKFQITATPVEFGKTGKRSYFIDERCVIHSTTENRPANENDETIDHSFVGGLEDFDTYMAVSRRRVR